MSDISQLFYNKDFRQKIQENPKVLLENIQKEYTLEDVDIKVVVNTKDIVYMAIPMDPSVNFDLTGITAAAAAQTPKLSTIVTIACAGTIATVSSTLSTGGSVGTLGSFGSVQT